MNEETKAGKCAFGWRHRWGKEVLNVKGATHSVYWQYCQSPHCYRVRVIEYTKRGNHIRGYRTEEGQP